MAYLAARCMDRVNDHQGCLKFCDDWLRKISDIGYKDLRERHNVVRLQRVRASTLADGFCIGKMTSAGARVIVPDVLEFFARIVHDEKLRESGDFCYLARLREWTEQYEEAEVILSRAQSLYPRYWEIPFQRASLRWRAHDFGGAIDHAERAVQLAPWRTQTLKLLALVQEGLGNASQAKATEARAMEIERARRRLDTSIKDS